MDKLDVRDFFYELPQERIALYPLKDRDHAKLLVWKNGKVTHSVFSQLHEFLPANAFLFFNDTKVIPARIRFQKSTGAAIEIFLLHPLLPSSLLQQTMEAKGKCRWTCVIGNLKRWNDGVSLIRQTEHFALHAMLISREESVVEFNWTDAATFAEVVNEAGETPLPPYLRRLAEPSDRISYQTIYSHHEGAVAAPTAGLHFTENVFDALKRKQIGHDFLTLHVSAGTFQPIKSADANLHRMHHEQIIITRLNIENLLKPGRLVVAVGTTSMRTLESVYWYGVKLLKGQTTFFIHQDDPWFLDQEVTVPESLHAVLQHMALQKTDLLIGETSIFIRPGYKFRICKALITNFHQPGSTLILLVAAFTGQHWKQIYREALDSGYRFLSYGDSSLLFPAEV
jgi:S-adenosylmethionine:tRNA ribosyltransferase-isomerase